MKTVIARMAPVVLCVPCDKIGFDLLRVSVADVDFCDLAAAMTVRSAEALETGAFKIGDRTLRCLRESTGTETASQPH